MKSPTEILERETRDEHAGPRDQFVRQVEDESLPANQVLEEQRNSRKPDDAAPLFIP